MVCHQYKIVNHLDGRSVQSDSCVEPSARSIRAPMSLAARSPRQTRASSLAKEVLSVPPAQPTPIACLQELFDSAVAIELSSTSPTEARGVAHARECPPVPKCTRLVPAKRLSLAFAGNSICKRSGGAGTRVRVANGSVWSGLRRRRSSMVIASWLWGYCFGSTSWSRRTSVWSRRTSGSRLGLLSSSVV